VLYKKQNSVVQKNKMVLHRKNGVVQNNFTK